MLGVRVAAAVLLAVVGGACSEGDARDLVASTTTGRAGLSLQVEEFDDPGDIPDRHSLEGGNIAPTLVWERVPSDAVELVVTVTDRDAGGFVHWLVAGIPPEADGIGAGRLPEGAVEGRNDFGQVGYGGPAPPDGEQHRYEFRVTAYGATTGLEAGFTSEDLLGAASGELLNTDEVIRFFGG